MLSFNHSLVQLTGFSSIHKVYCTNNALFYAVQSNYCTKSSCRDSRGPRRDGDRRDDRRGDRHDNRGPRHDERQDATKEIPIADGDSNSDPDMF